jgi:hypothetical protein
LVAQEVEEVFPEWVGRDSEGSKTVCIRGFEALTIEALRELRQGISELRELLTSTSSKPGATRVAAANEKSTEKPAKAADRRPRDPHRK